MDYILSKKKPQIGDRGFIIGNRFIPIQKQKDRIPSSGLVFYWSLINSNIESGQTLKQTSGLSFEQKDGRICGHFQNGINTITNDFAPLGTSPRTLSFWYWRNVKTNTEQEVFFSYGIRELGQACLFQFNRTDIDMYYSMWGYDFYYPNPIYNQWIHVVGTYDSGIVKIYQNGILKQLTPVISDGVIVNTSSQGDFCVGCFTGSNPPDRRYNGWLSSIRIYNRALTEKEINVLSQEFTV